MPVARVAVDIPLAHLDRLFDYAIPDSMAHDALPGVRVKVPFAGTSRDGWLVELAGESEVSELASLRRIVSTEKILTPGLFQLIRAVADHYAGTWWDVARLAIPPRHATTEKAPQRTWPEPKTPAPATVLPTYPRGRSLLDALNEGRSPRAAWLAAAVDRGPGDLIGGVLEAAAATLGSGRGVVIVVPTARDLAALAARTRAIFGNAAVGVLSADMGPSARYRSFLAASRGEARIVVGTRSAIFAPVTDLGLIAVVDDGNDAHSEPKAPHPHARSVAVLRAAQESTALLLAGYGRSTDAQALVERGWLGEVALPAPEARRVQPPVRAVDEVDREKDPAAARLRIPSVAFRFLRGHLPQGPVLVQVPMVGYAASLTCRRCRNRALCPKCQGPMRMRVKGVAECSLCGHQPPVWRCPHCHTTGLSAPLAGAARTAEELARAFPGVLAINSSGDRIKDEVPAEPAIVVATPGAEPSAPGGYAAALILDGEVTLNRADLRAGEDAVRRWAKASARVRSPGDGGSVLLVGPSSHPAVQAMVRAELPRFIQRELADRSDAGLPPAVKVARVSGDSEAVRQFLDNDEWTGIELLGPTETLGGRWAALLRAPMEHSRVLTGRIKHAAAIRSARKEPGQLSIRVDPETLED